MEVTRRSLYSGKVRTLDLNITEEQMEMYKKGMHSRFAFPNLNKDEREFINTEITGEEWEEMFADCEKEDSCEQGEDSSCSSEERAEKEHLAGQGIGIMLIILHP